MFHIINKKSVLQLVLAGSLFMLSGCSKDLLVMKAYTPPKKQKEVKEMLASNEHSNGFLKIQIVEDVDYTAGEGASKAKKEAAKQLFAQLKKYLTQTEFIKISAIEDESSVSLDAQILKFEYKQSQENGLAKVTALVEVAYNIRKDHETFYTQTYKKSVKRQTRGGVQSLPTQAQILSDITEYLAKKLIKDISPLKTRKLVELASLPSELAYTIELAKKGNFEGAIEAMEAFKGEKEYEFYFNLAVYYEGLAANEEDIALLTKSDAYYKKAMALGGSDDDTVIKGKTQFDKFYKIIRRVAEQKIENLKANESSKYEILD